MKKFFPRLDNKAILAPMSGVTNVAFRSLCKSAGAAMTFTEFVSSTALVRGNGKSFVMTQVAQNESPCGVQLFGSSEEEVLIAAQKLQDSFDVIDINVGCPAYKVVRQGCGSELLRNPQKVGALVRKLANNLDKPVTVKIRSGINKKLINAVEVATICEENGAAAITVHARTQSQGFSGDADWSVIAHVKRAVGIPVIGNGDIRNEHDAARMLQETGCDYVMIGRAAKDNPYLFTRINHFLQRGATLPPLSLVDQMKILFRYYDLLDQFGFEHIEFFKRSAQSFTKGFEGSATVRLAINDARTVDDVRRIIEQYLEEKSLTVNVCRGKNSNK
ncbi:tRNA dihydrouridine synthase DusB [Candidatus Woesearchaeota archaeon]|nr:tRNA dihydrouridine synthase DusB [Candidatus Woesearchaeota archaeon]